ncbi:MAG: tetratricopeptide repeat protein [Candidatus Omnitrophota bacterium]|jgi:tetratricopeptide (TPR) repeat protein
MRNIPLLCLLMFFAFSGSLKAADSPEGLYEKGNACYEDGDYDKAVSFYEQLIKMDRVSPEVFYNLGNSYYKLKKTGKAILNYERALREAPRDRNIRFNLEIARSAAVDKISAGERGLILDAAAFLYDRVSLDELTAACSFFYLAVILLLILSIFFVARRKGMLYAAGSLGVVLFAALIFLAAKIRDEDFIKKGIITAEKVDARSGPKEDYLVQFTLHEGAKIVVLEKAQGWYEIDLSGDLKGWIPDTSVDII